MKRVIVSDKVLGKEQKLKMSAEMKRGYQLASYYIRKYKKAMRELAK